MISRSIALGLLAAGCVTAAGGGAYVAVRQNAAEPQAAVVSPAPAQPAVAGAQDLIIGTAVLLPAAVKVARDVKKKVDERAA